MQTRYRVIEERKGRARRWQPIGAVYERAHGGGIHAFPMIGAGDQHANWRVWKAIGECIDSYGRWGPSLEDYHLVFQGYADRYRLSDEIYTVEGESYNDIRERLYQRYVLGIDQTPVRPAVVTYDRTAEPALATIHEEPITYTSREEENTV